jgi:hypothetical protein
VAQNGKSPQLPIPNVTYFFALSTPGCAAQTGRRSGGALRRTEGQTAVAHGDRDWRLPVEVFSSRFPIRTAGQAANATLLWLSAIFVNGQRNCVGNRTLP